MIALQVMSTLKRRNSLAATFHRVQLNGCAPSSIKMLSLFFSSSSYSNWDRIFIKLKHEMHWHEMFNKLKSQALKIKPTKETTIRDKLLAKYAENEDYVSLFSDAAFQDKSLRQWVNRQRSKLRTGKHIPQEQIELFNGLNFIWSPQEHIWNIRLNELRAFREKYGHCLVPRKTYIHFPRLGLWVNGVRVRKNNQESLALLTAKQIADLDNLNRKNNQEKEAPSRRRGFLTAKQIADLDNLNFEWDAYEAMWLEKFNDLKEFYKMNGHAHVTHSNCADEALVQWAKDQRQHCMIEERRKLLNSIEFIWSFSEMREDQWLESFNKLKRFHRMNGHAKVAKSNCADKSLVCWVSDQRKLCKIDERIKLLNSVGFVWPESRDATGENPRDVGKTFDDF